MAAGRPEFSVNTKRRSFDLPKTWAEFKAAVEDAGVIDDDRIFMIDVGPDAEVVLLERDEVGVEITGGSDARRVSNAGSAGGSATGAAEAPTTKGGRRADLVSRRQGAHRAAGT
jgi:hypothetical protein